MREQKITIQNGKLQVPDNPLIPFMDGDGTGNDIWPASKLVFDNAVAKADNGSKKINRKEVYAGQKASRPIIINPGFLVLLPCPEGFLPGLFQANK